MQLPGGNVSLRGTIGCSPLGVLQRGMGGCLQELHGGLVHAEELHRHRLDKRQSILGGVAHWKGSLTETAVISMLNGAIKTHLRSDTCPPSAGSLPLVLEH